MEKSWSIVLLEITKTFQLLWMIRELQAKKNQMCNKHVCVLQKRFITQIHSDRLVFKIITNVELLRVIIFSQYWSHQLTVRPNSLNGTWLIQQASGFLPILMIQQSLTSTYILSRYQLKKVFQSLIWSGSLSIVLQLIRNSLL